MIHITVYSGSNEITKLQESGDRIITIGRSKNCIIRLEHISISRLHADIKYLDPDWIIEKKSMLCFRREQENLLLL